MRPPTTRLLPAIALSLAAVLGALHAPAGATLDVYPWGIAVADDILHHRYKGPPPLSSKLVRGID